MTFTIGSIMSSRSVLCKVPHRFNRDNKDLTRPTTARQKAMYTDVFDDIPFRPTGTMTQQGTTAWVIGYIIARTMARYHHPSAIQRVIHPKLLQSQWPPHTTPSPPLPTTSLLHLDTIIHRSNADTAFVTNAAQLKTQQHLNFACVVAAYVLSYNCPPGHLI